MAMGSPGLIIFGHYWATLLNNRGYALVCLMGVCIIEKETDYGHRVLRDEWANAIYIRVYY